jgi:D-glycero-D-manno-heptose 1,7-bisphosphate phosphatase
VSRPAVFLDRDGTLIEERGYLDRMELLELFPWTTDAIRLLNRAGYAVVVVTNQSAVGRGIITEAFLQSVHDAVTARLSAGGARIDAFYVCPHHPFEARGAYRQTCRCRKPGPGLIEQACRDLDLDPASSFMVGDRWIDVACGQAAGTHSLLLRTGYGAHQEKDPPVGPAPDAILNNLMEAVGWILRRSSR